METDVRKIGNVSIAVKKELDVEQRALMATQMAHLHQSLNTMVEERKATVREYKEDENALKQQIEAISNQINNGIQEEFVEALLTIDYEKKKRVYLSLDTSEILKEEAMTSEDYQYFLNLGGEDLRPKVDEYPVTPDDAFEPIDADEKAEYHSSVDELAPTASEPMPIPHDPIPENEVNLPGIGSEPFTMQFENSESDNDPIPLPQSDNVELPQIEEKNEKGKSSRKNRS